MRQIIRPLSLEIRHEIWANAIRIYFGHWLNWRFAKYRMLPDQYLEEMREALEIYCAGGEL